MKFKVLSLTALVALGMAACQQSAPNAPKASPTEQAAPTANAETLPWAGDQDLVCEMKVDQTAEDTVHYGGKVYGFCGQSCKEDFQANPAKFVGK